MTIRLPPPSKLSEQLQIILEEKVPIASFAMGDPVKYVDQIHSTGAKIISMVTNVEDAISVAKNGSDIVMAQGSEAGGHRFIFDNNGALDDGYENIPLIGTMALVPQIVDALKKEIQARSIPVVGSWWNSRWSRTSCCLSIGSIRDCNWDTFFGMP